MGGRLRALLRYFARGLLALVPLVVVVFAVDWLFGLINKSFGPASGLGRFIATVAGHEKLAYLVSYALLLGAVLALGFVLGRPAARRALRAVNTRIATVPVLGKLYAAVVQVTDMLDGRERRLERFGGVGLVKAGELELIGFLTTPEQYTLASGESYYLVFLPNSPIPATGFNVLVRADAFTALNLPVAELAKLLMSLGLLGPQVLPRSCPAPGRPSPELSRPDPAPSTA